jgi:hypothetical protein
MSGPSGPVESSIIMRCIDPRYSDGKVDRAAAARFLLEHPYLVTSPGGMNALMLIPTLLTIIRAARKKDPAAHVKVTNIVMVTHIGDERISDCAAVRACTDISVSSAIWGILCAFATANAIEPGVLDGVPEVHLVEAMPDEGGVLGPSTQLEITDEQWANAEPFNINDHMGFVLRMLALV